MSSVWKNDRRLSCKALGFRGFSEFSFNDDIVTTITVIRFSFLARTLFSDFFYNSQKFAKISTGY